MVSAFKKRRGKDRQLQRTVKSTMIEISSGGYEYKKKGYLTQTWGERGWGSKTYWNRWVPLKLTSKGAAEQRQSVV